VLPTTTIEVKERWKAEEAQESSEIKTGLARDLFLVAMEDASMNYENSQSYPLLPQLNASSSSSHLMDTHNGVKVMIPKLRGNPISRRIGSEISAVTITCRAYFPCHF
jgi:hypothetical protein